MDNTIKKAENLFKSNKKEEAVIVLTKSLEKNFYQLPLILQLSTYLSYGGEFDQAEELLKKAKTMFPSELSIDYNLGNIYFSQEKYDYAYGIFENLVKSNFGHDALFMLAQTLKNMSDYSHALVYAITAYEKNPKDENYAELVGDIFLSMGILEEAEIYFNKSYNINNNGKNVFKLAITKMANGEESTTFFEIAKETDFEYYKNNLQKIDDIQKLVNNSDR